MAASMSPPPARPGRSAVPLCLAIVFGGLALLLLELWYLRSRREDHLAEAADAAVGARVESARGHMAQGEWDEAVRQLEAAAGVSGSRRQADVAPLLGEARQGQAGALLAAARSALARADAGRARELLRAYRRHPGATRPEEARALEDDLARATSEEFAVGCLRRMSDAELSALARGGKLPPGGGLCAEVQPALRETLRQHAGAEQGRRDARRRAERLEERRRAAELARREARLRGTEAFRGVSELSAWARRAKALGAREERAMEELLRQLGVAGREEREEVRARLRGVGLAEELGKEVAHRRAAAKKAFRESAEFRAEDAETFDRLVDRELDALLKALR
jgi:hypothetical protein